MTSSEPRPTGLYCGQCGTKGLGNFCTHCGAPLGSATPLETATRPAVGADAQHSETRGSAIEGRSNIDVHPEWASEFRYDALISNQEVQHLVSLAAQRAKTPMTGEAFLKATDKVATPLTGGFSVSKYGKTIQTFTKSLGFEYSRNGTKVTRSPIGIVLVAVLCSLAESGQQVRSVLQMDTGCEIASTLPSDLFSFEGDFQIRVTSERD